jgi:hypothetical protein
LTPTPLLDFFKRGEADRDVRLLAAQGVLAPRAHEQLAILVLLLDDPDPEVRRTAAGTIERIPVPALVACLARADVPEGVREFFAGRGIAPAGVAPLEAGDPLIETEAADGVRAAGAVDLDAAGDPAANGLGAPGDPAAQDADPGDTVEAGRQSIVQQLARMGFTERLKAAMTGPREVRAILVRDPNRMIAASVLSSPKLTEQEVESFARMANVGEEVLRTIAGNRAWIRNYGVVVGLARNPKTPLAISLSLMNRLNDRDLQVLSNDRNVPEPLRIAARKRVVASTSRR